MSKVEPGPNAGAAFISDSFTEIMAVLGQVSPEDFTGRMLEKLIADGLLELKPGCSKEQAAGMFTAAFKTIKIKMPATS
ncbi:MAG: hypothetical protein JWM30_2809 [Burkholderia sp.]|jgi:hypothetical protein|nr:hypothetical protein [Burkholderia sp.]